MPAPLLPAEPWKVGDPVYALRVDPRTSRYRVHGVGRIVRIEGAVLHLRSIDGPITWGVSECPAFKSRADAEAYIAENPKPGGDRGPMAHHGPDRPR